jgi:hypothetical protein
MDIDAPDSWKEIEGVKDGFYHKAQDEGGFLNRVAAKIKRMPLKKEMLQVADAELFRLGCIFYLWKDNLGEEPIIGSRIQDENGAFFVIVGPVDVVGLGYRYRCVCQRTV